MSGRRDLVPFAGLRAHHPPSTACQLDAYFPEYTAGEWRLIALACAIENELLNDFDPLDYPEPRKRNRAPQGTPQSSSTRSGRVGFDHDDPLKRIPASQYLPVIAGTEVSSSGRCRCPMPDHPDEHPSCKAYGTEWKCFACGAGNTIIDIASAVSGIPTTGRDYWRLRDWILERLVWAPLPHEGER